MKKHPKIKHLFKGMKVLPHTVYLESRAEFREVQLLEELNNYHKEIPPVFNRTGEYLVGDECWFEVRGRAFIKRKVDFLFELRQCEMAEISRAAVIKLVELQRVYPHMLSKEQISLILDYRHFLEVRTIKRTGRKNLKEMKKRLANEVSKMQNRNANVREGGTSSAI